MTRARIAFFDLMTVCPPLFVGPAGARSGGAVSFGPVLNAITLWTTKYIHAAVAQLRAEGHEI